MTTLGHVLAFAVAFVFVASIWNRLHERTVRCNHCGSHYHRTGECLFDRPIGLGRDQDDE